MAQFEKGTSGNPNGRPTGSKNKATADLRQRVTALLTDQWDKLLADLDALEPRDRVAAMLKLMEYSLPKLTRQQLQIEQPDQKKVAVVVYRSRDEWQQAQQDENAAIALPHNNRETA